MSSLLLDKFRPPSTQFRPSTAPEVFALRLAQRLGEPRAVQHFLALVEAHSEGQLICAYRRAVRNRYADLGRGFHKELEQIHSNGHREHSVRLIAIRVERRTIGAAIFNGERLEFADSRQLSSDNERAVASGAGFIRWLLQRFSVESAAMEAIPVGEFQRRALHNTICDVVRSEATNTTMSPFLTRNSIAPPITLLSARGEEQIGTEQRARWLQRQRHARHLPSAAGRSQAVVRKKSVRVLLPGYYAV
jgi:hypothetical protein